LRGHIKEIPAVDRVRRPGIVRLAGVRLAALVALLALGAATLPAVGSASSPGQLYTFGANYHGELGDETNNYNSEPNPTPALVTLPGASGPVTQAAGGGGFSLALTASDQLYSFGENWFGELGNETNVGDMFAANPTPTLVTLPGEVGAVTQVAAGQGHSLAVTSSGQLYAFGNNGFGQLGIEDDDKSAVGANPTPTLVTLPGASGPVAKVAAGGFHTLALTSTGQLYAFGDNSAGQLGRADVGDTNSTPTLVTLPGEVGPVTQIAAGAYFSLAVTASGQLYAFGNNYDGQLGNPTNNWEYTAKNPTPTLVTLPGEVSPVTQVAAGYEHSLVLTSSDQLYAFGENRYGELGNTTNNRTDNPNPTPTLVRLPGARGPITRIAAGDGYSLVLTTTGQLYAFGSDDDGELGFPPGEERGAPHPTPQQVALPGGANVETIANGCWSGQTLVVLDDLSVVNSTLPVGEIGLPYSAQAQGTGGAAPYTWSASGLPPGLSIDPESGAISGTPTAAGSFTPTITATDGNGIEAPTPLTLEIKGPYEPPPPPPTEKPPPTTPHEPSPPPAPNETSPPPGSHRTAPSPSVDDARQSATRWREGNRLAHRISRAKTQIGTTFSFSLNEQATVSLGFLQLLGGRRSGHGCLAATHDVQRESCNSTVTRGTLSLAGHSGTNNVVFAGRILRTNKLQPGRYELVITAINSSGKRSAPVSLSFTIAK
jgi:alpha-tubulin suppressor-like RCC1 family protein